MKRKIYDKLLEWKKCSAGRYALLIEGARRVGKSYIVETFAKNEYRHCLVLDFSRVKKEVKDLFEEKLDDLDELFMLLEARTKVRLVPGETLIVFDEVQLFPKAREAIKHLVKDGRFHYIETGSLISIKRNVEDILIPSEEMRVKMFPMDFEEFLWAVGREGMARLIRKRFVERKPLDDADHRQGMELFRQYLVVGGMPQAVEAFVRQKVLRDVEAAKRAILDLYADDIGKFAGRYKNKVRAIWAGIPGALARHERRFRPGFVGEDVRMRELDAPFEWLSESMTVNLAYNTTDPNCGFRMSEEREALKCYLGDTGLLVSHAFSENEKAREEMSRQILLGKIALNTGMLVENAVAQMFRAAGQELFFHSTHDAAASANTMEIDFLLTRTNVHLRRNVHPVEVKSTNRYSTLSLDKFERKFPTYCAEGIVVHPGPLKVEGRRIYLPLYMAALIPELEAK